MRSTALVVAISALASLSGCQDRPVSQREPADRTSAKVVQPLPPSKPIVPKNDKQPFFGIDLKALSTDDSAVVRSAWENYQRVLAGKHPDCPLDSGFSDGGTLIYDCVGYEMIRYKSLLPPGLPDSPDLDKVSFTYGPSIKFASGHKVERLWVLDSRELVRLEAAP